MPKKSCDDYVKHVLIIRCGGDLYSILDYFSCACSEMVLEAAHFESVSKKSDTGENAHWRVARFHLFHASATEFVSARTCPSATSS